jgi:glucose/arabinose dehydrogenase
MSRMSQPPARTVSRISLSFQTDRKIYFTYSEPGNGGNSLALSRATLAVLGLVPCSMTWRQTPKGSGGQPGGIIAFDRDGSHLFLTSCDRMRPTTAQDSDQALGKGVAIEPRWLDAD